MLAVEFESSVNSYSSKTLDYLMEMEIKFESSVVSYSSKTE